MIWPGHDTFTKSSEPSLVTWQYLTTAWKTSQRWRRSLQPWAQVLVSITELCLLLLPHSSASWLHLHCHCSPGHLDTFSFSPLVMSFPQICDANNLLSYFFLCLLIFFHICIMPHFLPPFIIMVASPSLHFYSFSITSLQSPLWLYTKAQVVFPFSGLSNTWHSLFKKSLSIERLMYI